MDMALNTLREKRQELSDRVAAIVDLAEGEKRELSAEETGIIDSIVGKGDTGGEIAAIDEKIERFEKIQARQKEIAAKRFSVETGNKAEPDSDGVPYSQIKIPAKVRRTANLKSYIGPNAEKEAFIAGNVFAAALHGRKECFAWLEDHGIQMAHSTTDNTKGGYTVPDPVEPNIVRLVELIDGGNAGSLKYNKHVYQSGFKGWVYSPEIGIDPGSGNMFPDTEEPLFSIYIDGWGWDVEVTVYMPDDPGLDFQAEIFSGDLEGLTLNGEKVTDDVRLTVFNGAWGLSTDFLEFMNGLKYVGGNE